MHIGECGDLGKMRYTKHLCACRENGERLAESKSGHPSYAGINLATHHSDGAGSRRRQRHSEGETGQAAAGRDGPQATGGDAA